MKKCIKCSTYIHDNATRCRHCYAEQPQNPSNGNMMMTSGNSFSGYEIIEYLDYICEDIVYSHNFVSNVSAGLKDTVSGFKSIAQSQPLTGTTQLMAQARNYAMENFQKRVRNAGGNAVIGLDVDAVVGANLVKVSLNGTAVYIIRDVDATARYKEALRLQSEYRQKQEAEAKEAAEVALANTLETINSTFEYTALDKNIIKILQSNSEGVRVMDIAKSLPRTISPSDISASLNRLVEAKIIYNDLGKYKLP